MISLPGALVLYYTVSNIVAVAQQAHLLRQDQDELEEITKQGIDKRLRQHIQNGKSFSHLDEQLSGLTRNQARAIEQYLIENGDANTLNKINSISPNNIFYDDAKTWAENYINRGY